LPWKFKAKGDTVSPMVFENRSFPPPYFRSPRFDRLELQTCVKKVDLDAKVFCQKACANLYYELLGDWKEWKEVAKIKNPEIRLALLERIKKLLYWEKGD
jgi:hypothetical protein